MACASRDMSARKRSCVSRLSSVRCISCSCPNAVYIHLGQPDNAKDSRNGLTWLHALSLTDNR